MRKNFKKSREKRQNSKKQPNMRKLENRKY